MSCSQTEKEVASTFFRKFHEEELEKARGPCEKERRAVIARCADDSCTPKDVNVGACSGPVDRHQAVANVRWTAWALKELRLNATAVDGSYFHLPMPRITHGLEEKWMALRSSIEKRCYKVPTQWGPRCWIAVQYLGVDDAVIIEIHRKMPKPRPSGRLLYDSPFR
jgi:hypothetical protein